MHLVVFDQERLSVLHFTLVRPSADQMAVTVGLTGWPLLAGNVQRSNDALLSHERLKEAFKAGRKPLYVVDGGIPGKTLILDLAHASMYCMPFLVQDMVMLHPLTAGVLQRWTRVIGTRRPMYSRAPRKTCGIEKSRVRGQQRSTYRCSRCRSCWHARMGYPLSR